MRRAILLALLAGGCTPKADFPFMRIVDQRSFEPGGLFGGPAQPRRAPEPAQVRALPPLPLVVIRFTAPDMDIAPAVNEAVGSAQARKPDVEFDVIAIVPGDAEADQPTKDGETVARALADRAVPPERIHVSLLADPLASGREVRIFVR